MKKLVDALHGAGKGVEVLGDRVAILPFSGRVLGIFPTPDVNVLWTNTALEGPDTAKALWAEDGWINPGGIRAWISPECETHVSDPGRFWDTYVVPSTVDPGNYRVSTTDEKSVSLEIEMQPMFYRHGIEVPLHLHRKFSLMESAGMAIPSEVAFAGIKIESVLSFIGDGPDGVRPGLWTLVQVPGGGEIRVPVKDKAKPVTMFGNPEISSEGGHIRCKVETDEKYKFSLHADDCRGVMCYMKPDGNKSTLIVVRLPVLEQALYADTPATDLNDTGHAQQVYVDNGDMGGFGELEYHTPTLEKGLRDEIKDSGDIRTFVGPVEAIQDVLGKVL